MAFEGAGREAAEAVSQGANAAATKLDQGLVTITTQLIVGGGQLLDRLDKILDRLDGATLTVTLHLKAKS